MTSLFRGMGAPLATATGINAIVFGSYGFSSRLYDVYLPPPATDDAITNHDPWQKSLTCGAFAGAVQCFVIGPTEHIKCRLQIQSSTTTTSTRYQGPLHAVRHILQHHGVTRLFQGFSSTALREIPAFGVYFASYDALKDLAVAHLGTSSSWLASAWAGGCAGSLTWAMVYPVDVIKTRIQTAPLDTAWAELGLWRVGRDLVRHHGGVQCLFRGLGVTLVRAFPVNGTIFPVYECVLQHMVESGY